MNMQAPLPDVSPQFNQNAMQQAATMCAMNTSPMGQMLHGQAMVANPHVQQMMQPRPVIVGPSHQYGYH